MPALSETITIARRFCGPPDSGNGGYVCGLLGQRLPGIVEVTLRAPPPLDHPLAVSADGAGGLQLMDGDQLVATARPGTLDLELPPVPAWEDAAAASGRYIGLSGHLFPGCFVCGPDRDPGDGLRVFAGPVDGGDGQRIVATHWTPDASLSDDQGHVRPEYAWAALDCPGYFAVCPTVRALLLGRLTVQLERPLRVGQSYLVLGWSTGGEGRKAFAGTALLDRDGQVMARAQAVWIALKDA